MLKERDRVKKDKTQYEKLFIGEEIDIYMKSKELDNGRVKITVDFDLKTERVKKIFENNPKLIKKAILKLMPPSMRLKSKLGGYPKITDEDEGGKNEIRG